MDTTQQRVRQILTDGAAQAYPVAPAVTVDDILDICGCSHGLTAHHGPDGMGRCGEAGCDCGAWHAAQIECPDCGVDWVELGTSCPGCDLTIETLAERMARR